MGSRLRLLAVAALALLTACGGGGGSGSSGSGTGGGSSGGTNSSSTGDAGSTSGGTIGDTARLDRASVAITWEQGGAPAEGVVEISASSPASSPLYVGVGTPGGRSDPNVDHVAVDMQSATRASVRLLPNAALASGSYGGTLAVRACADAGCAKSYAGSPFEVAYSFTVTPPASAFDASPRTLLLEGEAMQPLAQLVKVTLPAGATAYTATPSDAAVRVDQVTPAGFRVTVPARAVGSYASTIELAAGTLKRTVTVQHTATPWRLKLAQTGLALTAVSGAPASATLGLVHLPEGQTAATVSNDGNPWLSVVPAAGGWSVTAASVPAGKYVGSVSVQSGADRVTVPVRYDVQPPLGGERPFPIGLTRATLASPVGGAVASQGVGVFTSSWSKRIDTAVDYDGATGWLAIASDEFGNLTFSANPAGLSAGIYRAVATIGSDWPAVPVRVPVSFTVGDGLVAPASHRKVVDNYSPDLLTDFFPVRNVAGEGLAWTAATATPWLRLKAASGSAGSAVEYTIDTAQVATLPSFTDIEGSVTISARSAAGVALAPMTVAVTLRRELAEVHSVGPAQIVAGVGTEVLVRGRGFDRLSFANGGWVQVKNASVVNEQRLSDTTLKMTLTPSAAGEYAVTLYNRFGFATGSAALRAFDARPLPAAALATGGSVRSVLHDAARQQVFVANTGLGAIQRFRLAAGGWTADRLTVADLFDIGLSADGNWLLAAERGGKLHLIDPATFAISASYAAPGALYPIPGSGHGIAVTNDGRAWLTVAGSGGSANRMVSFDLRARDFTVERPAGVAATFDGGPWYEASRNGERLLVVQGSVGSPPPPMLYVDMARNLWRSTPAGLTFFYFSLNGLSDDGRRAVVLGNVFDADFGFVGRPTIPDAGYGDNAAVLSPDGRRLYVFSLPGDWNDAASASTPRIYAFDAAAASPGTTSLPLAGVVKLADYPGCRLQTVSGECNRPVMNVAADGRTLFVAGDAKLLVVPVPTFDAP